MSPTECGGVLVDTFVILLIGSLCSVATAQSPNESTQTEIARALSAAPPDVARESAVA
jgi:hypothetical protein